MNKRRDVLKKYWKIHLLVSVLNFIVCYKIFDVGMASFTTFFLISPLVLLVVPQKKVVSIFKIGFFIWFIIILFVPWVINEKYIFPFVMGPPMFWMYLSLYFTKPESKEKYDDLTDKIRHDLGITYTTSKSVEFPKGLRWIGGLVSPLFPFVSVLNKSWKKKLNAEAKIHENVHIHLLLNKGYMFFGLVILLIISFFADYIEKNINLIVGRVLLFAFISCLLVFFEKKTFDVTHEYGRKLGILTRQFTKKKAIEYFFFYFIFGMIATGLFALIRGGLKWFLLMLI